MIDERARCNGRRGGAHGEAQPNALQQAQREANSYRLEEHSRVQLQRPTVTRRARTKTPILNLSTLYFYSYELRAN